MYFTARTVKYCWDRKRIKGDYEKDQIQCMEERRIWHTATDREVPVGNSMVFADACFRSGVPCACHIFSEGEHGMGVADSPDGAECSATDRQLSKWTELVMDWLACLKF